MKRVFIFVCSVLAQMTALVGCNGVEDHKTITCADVISAYEAAGYEVWHNEYTEGDFLCLVNAENDDGDTIYFTFFNFFFTDKRRKHISTAVNKIMCLIN